MEERIIRLAIQLLARELDVAGVNAFLSPSDKTAESWDNHRLKIAEHIHEWLTYKDVDQQDEG